MNSRYWSASFRIEILAISTFWLRASVSSRSSGPSKPSTATTSASSGAVAVASNSSKFSRAFAHACTLQKLASDCASAAAGSNASGALRCDKRVLGARAAPAPSSGFTSLCHFPHLVHLAVAVKHDVAAGEQCRLCPRRRSARPAHSWRVVRLSKARRSRSRRESRRGSSCGLVVAGRCGSIAS